MLKLSQNALGMLIAKYKAVLKNMRLKNLVPLAASCLIFCAAPALAATDYNVGGPATKPNYYATLDALRNAATQGIIAFADGDTITVHDNDSSLNAPLDFQGKNVTIDFQDKSSAIITPANFAHKFITTEGGTVTLANADNAFIRGFAQTAQGGAIYGGFGSTINIEKGVVFESNEVFNDGGAIYGGYNSAINIGDGNTFQFNKATDYGGAIFGDGGSTITIGNGNTFNNNEAKYGGAILGWGVIDIGDDNKFENNSAANFGGAIWGVGDITIDGDNIFTGNKANNSGGAIYGEGGVITIGNVNTFEDNSATNYGGAIRGGNSSTIDIGNDNTFKNNSANSGGAIFGEGAITIGYGNIFEDNKANGNGGAIYGMGDITIDHSSTFENNSAANGNGGAIYGEGGVITIGDSNDFKENSANNGGAIYGGNNSTIDIRDNSTFTDNEATNAGGAIFSEGNITIGNVNTFENNSAINYGGAIRGGNYSTITIRDGNQFENNSAATGNGGAIFGGDYSTINIGDDNTFKINKAATGNGGAIFGGNYSTINIGEDNTFENNKAISGGAICGWGDIYIDYDNTFENNSANSGGAIFGEGDITIGGVNTFTGNTANYSGGAIFAVSNLTLTADGGDIIFRGNKADGKANAIYLENNDNNKTLTLSAGEGKSILFYDPVASNSNNADLTVTINETAADTGTVLFDSYQSNIYGHTTVHNGTMALTNGAVYGADSGNQSFALASGATLLSDAGVNAGGGGNKIQADIIDLQSGSRLSFDLTGAVNAGLADETTNLTLAGGGVDDNVHINILDFRGSAGAQTFNLVTASGGVTAGQGLTLRDEDFRDVRATASLAAVDNTLQITLNNTQNGEVTWTGGNTGDADIDNLWNATSKNWEGTIGGNAVDQFLHGDAVVFDAGQSGIRDIKILDSGVLIAQRGGNPGMTVQSGDWTFTGGKIEGGAIYFAGSGSIAFDTRALKQRITVADGITVGISALDEETLYVDGLSATYGGAVYGGANSTVKIEKGVVFANNEAANYGGAILSLGDIYIGEDNTFANNLSAIGGGGAIYSYNDITVGDSNIFESNSAKVTGGAIYGYNYITIGDDNTFENNSATTGNGGAIFGYNYITVGDRNTFESNSAKVNGGAIYGSGKITIGDDNTFAYNSANEDGGAVLGHGVISIGGGNTFAYNEATGDGGAIYGTTGSTINIVGGNTFVSNSANNGGAILGLGTIDVGEGNTFESNSANEDGGAIWGYTGDITIGGGSTFKNNSANSGGAIYGSGKITIGEGNTFESNLANKAGGAVYGSGNITIGGGNTFAYNDATTSGGAIYGWGDIDVGGGNTFANNSATGNGIGNGHGGAIWGHGAIIIGGDNIFENNSANNGGAIYGEGDIDIGGGNTFENNSAFYGGAIYGYGDITIGGGNTFKSNSANAYGGAIYAGANDVSTEINLAAAEKETILFTGNTDLSGANSIYFTGFSYFNNAKISLNVTGAGMVDMQDPLNSASHDFNIDITKTGSGTWKLGGENNFQADGGTGTTFTVKEGTLDLYQDAEILIGKGSFTLESGATLISRGENTINVINNTNPTGSGIDIQSGSTLGFDLTGADDSGGTTNLTLKGGGISDTVKIDILAFDSSTSGAKTYVLAKADNVDDFSGVSFTVRGEASTGTRLSGSSLTTDNINNTLTFTTNAQNGEVTWKGGTTGTAADNLWNAAAKNWEGTIDGTAVDQFLHGDAVVFDASGIHDIEIQADGVRIAARGGNDGMTIKSGDWTFTGGKIEGGAIYFAGSGSITFDTRALEQRITVVNGITAGISALDGAALSFNGLSGISGGAIYGGENSTVKIEKGVVFASNRAESGGAIFGADGSTINIGEGNKFENNSADSGGAIYGEIGSTIKIGGGNKFENNSANNYGGAILGWDDIDAGEGNTFENNEATNAGGAIFGGQNITAGNRNTFTNNSASEGGAIFGGGDIDVGERNEFKNNSADYSGGAILGSGVINVGEGNKFENNSANAGGAIFGRDDIDIGSGNTFESNSANWAGGAIYSYNYITVGGDNTFAYNSANDYGGAIYGEGDITIIGGGNEFENNSADSGGAIYGGSGSTIKIGEGNTFEKNKANEGGAIYGYGAITVGGGNKFENNSAESGGAILGWDDIDIGSGNTFENNEAIWTGGAIYGNGAITIGGSNTFANNSASNGGAIYGYGAITIGGGNDFENNGAVFGGAIYGSDAITIGGGNTFESNSATNYGGAIYAFSDLTLTADSGDILFRGNMANEEANAIYLYNSNDDKTLNLSAVDGKSILFYDPVASELVNANLTVTINENAADTGTVLFDTHQSDIYGATTVHNGTMALTNGATYGADGNQSFTLESGATLRSDANGNKVQADTIDLKDGSILAFDMDGATGTTTNLILSGGPDPGSQAIGAGEIDVYSPGQLAHGTYTLVEGQGSDFSFADTGLVYYNGVLKEHTRDENAMLLNADTANNSLKLDVADTTGKASLTWDGGTDGNWDADTRNWEGTVDRYKVSQFLNGDDVTFGDTGNNKAITVQNGVTVGDMTVNNMAGNDYSFSGGGISGGSLTKDGGGTLTLNNANSFSGGAALDGGRINIGNGLALGTGGFAMAGGTELGFDGGYTIANQITIAANASVNFDTDLATTSAAITGDIAGGSLGKTGAGTLTLSGNNTYSGGTLISGGKLAAQNATALGTGDVQNNAALEFALDENHSGGFNSQITGGGKLVKSGAGTLTLAGDNTYSGGTLISGGKLVAQNAIALGTGNIQNDAALEFALDENHSSAFNSQISGGGKLVKSGDGILVLAGNNDYSGGTSIDEGTLVAGNVNALGTNQVQNNAALVFNLNQSQSGSFGNKITGNGNLTKSDNGTLTLTGDNTYTGGTILDGGRINVGHDRALGSGGFAMAGGTELGFDGSFAIANQITIAANASVNFDTDLATTSAAITGDIAGGGFEKTGAGKLTVHNADVKNAALKAGTLEIAADKTLKVSGSLTTANNTVLSLSVGSNPAVQAGSVAFDPGGTLNVNGYGGGQWGNTVTLITSGTAITGLTGNYTVGGSTSVDYLNAAIRLSEDKQAVLADIILTWYDNHQTAPGIYDQAHGTFTLADASEAFEVQTVLADRTGTFTHPNNWDGKKLTKAGAGTLTLSGINTYSGGTLISGGTLAAQNINALGTGDVQNDAALEFALDENHSGGFGNEITGSGNLVKSGAGTLTLAGDNAYSGGTLISGGRLVAQNANALGTGNVQNNAALEFALDENHSGAFNSQISGGGKLVKSGDGILVLTGNNNYSGVTSIDEGMLVAENVNALGTNQVQNSAALAFNLDQSQSGSFANQITGGGKLTKSLNGTLTLTGDNTYTGGTILDGGRIDAGHDRALGSGGLAMADGTELGFDGNFTIANKITIAANAAVKFDTNLAATSAAITSDIAGGGFEKTGLGTLTVGNADVNSATVGEGTLNIATGKTLNASGSFHVADDAVLSIDAETTAVTADSVSFASDSIINLRGYSGSADGQTATLLTSNQVITNLTDNYTIGGSAAVDYLSSQIRLSEDKKSVLANTTLTWYDDHQDTDGKYDKAHGTFTVSGGNEFEVGTVLADRTGTFTHPNNWNGTTLTKEGAGTLILSGNNTYSGDTVINGGTLIAKNVNALGDNNGNIDIQTNATLEFNMAQDDTFGKQISGDGNLVKSGDGTLTLTGDNDYSGGTLLSQGGITIGSETALGSGTLAMGEGTTLGFGETLSFFSGDINLDGNGTLDTGERDLTLSGEIRGTSGLIKTGSGTLILTGSNAYSGETIIKEGVLTGNIADKTALTVEEGAAYNNGTGPVEEVAPVLFTLLRSGDSVPAAARELSALYGGGDVNMQGEDLTVNGGGDFSGSITGTGTSLIKDSSETLILSGVNTYSGNTIIKNGTLEVQNINALGTSGNIENTGVLNLFSSSFAQSTTYTINSYSGTGVVGIQASATADGHWSDILSFTGETPEDSVKVHFYFSDGSNASYIPDEGLKFAQLSTADGTDDTFKLNGVSAELHGAYQLDIKTDDKQNYNLISTFNPSAAKVYSESSAASLGQAVGMHGKQLFNATAQAARDAGKNGPGIYAGFERSDARYETGSHADVKGNNLALAMAWQANDKTAWGVFGQKFVGSYTTTHEVSLSGGNRTINSDGDLRSHDIGLFAEYRPAGKKDNGAGAYYKAVIRAGHSSNDFRSDNYQNTVSKFRSGRNLWGVSLGGGYVKDSGQNRAVEYYGHLIYTNLGSDSVTDSVNQNISFDSSDSMRLLSGARLNFNQNKKTSGYFGAALDYEFSGKADSYINGLKADSADIKGLTGILELGLRSKASDTLTIDLGLQGYVGKKRGLGGSLTLSKKF